MTMAVPGLCVVRAPSGIAARRRENCSEVPSAIVRLETGLGLATAARQQHYNLKVCLA